MGGGGGEAGARAVELAGVRGGIVLKAARFTSKVLRKCFEQERLVLKTLAEVATTSGTVPRLLGSGMRSGLNEWPVLLLEPRGTPLCDWVGEKCRKATYAGGGGGSGTTSALDQAALLVARVHLASKVCLDVLEALEAAHAHSIVHCDVRPSNIVVSGTGKGVLIDWGISRSVSKECGGCGVAAYADERVYTQGTYTARPAQDLSALLYTWLSVAHTHSCSTPWLAGALTDASMFATRKLWVNALSKENAGVKRVEDLLTVLGDDKGRASGKAVELLSMVRKLLKSSSGEERGY